VSAGLGVPMERLILNFGQVRVQGQLTGRELRDFAIAGVPLIDELAKNLGVTKERIADMVSEGKIGFPEVSTAFETMTSNGGKFEDLMDKQSKTFSGIVSNMSDEIGRLARDIIGINEAGEIIEGGFFERIKGAAERLLTYLSDNKEQIKAVVEETAQKIISFGTRVYEAIQSLIDFWKTSFGKTTIIAIGILVAALAGAAGSIVGIVALITGTIYLVYRAAKEVAGLWGDMWRLAEAYFREFQVRIWSRAIEIKNNLVGWARDTVNEIVDWFRTLPSRISSSISSATTGAASKIKGLLGFRAEGGPVSAGNPYIVGEKGPELFVPSGNGNIVPNNQISNSATVNFYGNINNTSNASLDDIGRRISRQIQLASQGI
jgi:tape measure domain-containing protein